MEQFNLNKFINRLTNQYFNTRGQTKAADSNIKPGAEFQLTQNALNQNLVQRTLARQANILTTFNAPMLTELKMNNLASLERSLYVKDIMRLPKELNEVLAVLQNNAAVTEETAKILNKNIRLSVLSEIIQKSGKEAMNKLILVMSNASKQGISDLSQIKDAIKFINASVSIAAQENPNQILKTFMLLYLPWLPLQEGVDFELSIESFESEQGDAESSVTIMISTRNYGNVKILLILSKPNSIDIFVNCSDKFPKEELLKRLNSESKKHSIQSNVSFEQKITQKEEDVSRQAKISMSNLTEVNPFLLLMVNSVIRHTIDLDNLAESSIN